MQGFINNLNADLVAKLSLIHLATDKLSYLTS